MARPIETDDEDLLGGGGFGAHDPGPVGVHAGQGSRRGRGLAATFIKRFGSKQRLFLRLSERWVESIGAPARREAESLSSPLDRLRAVALHNYHDLDHPATAHNQIAALAVDLQNHELRERLHVGWGHVRRHLTHHAEEAIAAGELAGCPPPPQLARVIAGAMEGGCIAWSVHPEGSLIDRLADDLTALLSGWTTPQHEQGSDHD